MMQKLYLKIGSRLSRVKPDTCMMLPMFMGCVHVPCEHGQSLSSLLFPGIAATTDISIHGT